MSSKEPGIVYCSNKLDDKSERVSIIEDISVPITKDLPKIVEAKGLSKKRKEYLFTDIREFCSEETKDLTAPDPDKY